MMTKWELMVTGLTMLIATSLANAENPSSDLCSKMPGHWQGIYTLKNQEQCTAYNGCTHLVRADVAYLSGNIFRIVLSPAVGRGGEFEVQCENGVITSPVNPEIQIRISCDTMNHCFVVYNDPFLISEMNRI